MRQPSVLSQWVKDGTTAAVGEISSPGVWELVNHNQLDRNTSARVTFRKGSGGDPIGAKVSAGIKVGALTPEEIAGTSLTLPSLSSSTASLPVRIYPDGRVCLTVSEYVSPFVVEVIQ